MGHGFSRPTLFPPKRIDDMSDPNFSSLYSVWRRFSRLLATALVRLDSDEAVRVAKETLKSMSRQRYAGLDEALMRGRCEGVFEAAEV